MGIEELKGHTWDEFQGHRRLLFDALNRTADYLSEERWATGALEYAVRQLEFARKYLNRAHATAMAQSLACRMADQMTLEEGRRK